jgi:hypothetical protein
MAKTTPKQAGPPPAQPTRPSPKATAVLTRPQLKIGEKQWR